MGQNGDCFTWTAGAITIICIYEMSFLDWCWGHLYRAWINQQVAKWPLCYTPYQFLPSYTVQILTVLSPPLFFSLLPAFIYFIHFYFYLSSSTPLTPCLSFPHLTYPPLSVSRTCAKRSLAMRLVLDGGRRILSFSSWPRCYPCLGPSPASWTKPQSSGWPSATCICAPLPARGTRPGALCWRATATAAKVS